MMSLGLDWEPLMRLGLPTTMILPSGRLSSEPSPRALSPDGRNAVTDEPVSVRESVRIRPLGWTATFRV